MRIAVLGEHTARDEGMANYTRAIVRSFEGAGATVFDRAKRVSARAAIDVVTPSTIAAVRRFRPNVVYYVPKSGLTLASAARTAILDKAVPRALTVPVFLQADPVLPRTLFPSRLGVTFVLDPDLLEQLEGRGVRARLTRVGVDRPAFTPEGPTQPDLWPDRPGKRVLHVGSLTQGRNLGVLTALARVGHACLVVGSTSTDASQDVIAELEHGGVRVLREFVPDIASVYRSADLYVFPAVGDRACIDLPLSVLEALACGVPVVATRWKGLRRFEHEFRGLRMAETETIIETASKMLHNAPYVDASAPPSWDTVAREQLEELERTRIQWHSRGRSVLILGLDGSGKSTQAKELSRRASERGLRAQSVWARWDPLFLRPAVRAAHWHQKRKGTEGATREFVDAKRRIFRSQLVRRVWASTASFDHAIQVVPRVLRALRCTDLVVLDRYYHDTLVDFALNFGDEAVAKKRGFLRLFPEPDEVVYLDGSPETLFARKGDVESLEYLEIRRPLYQALAAANSWRVIDAEKPVNEIADELEALLWPK